MAHPGGLCRSRCRAKKNVSPAQRRARAIIPGQPIVAPIQKRRNALPDKTYEMRGDAGRIAGTSSGSDFFGRRIRFRSAATNAP
jgi:hypothetical protein